MAARWFKRRCVFCLRSAQRRLKRPKLGLPRRSRQARPRSRKAAPPQGPQLLRPVDGAQRIALLFVLLCFPGGRSGFRRLSPCLFLLGGNPFLSFASLFSCRSRWKSSYAASCSQSVWDDANGHGRWHHQCARAGAAMASQPGRETWHHRQCGSAMPINVGNMIKSPHSASLRLRLSSDPGGLAV